MEPQKIIKNKSYCFMDSVSCIIKPSKKGSLKYKTIGLTSQFVFIISRMTQTNGWHKTDYDYWRKVML